MVSSVLVWQIFYLICSYFETFQKIYHIITFDPFLTNCLILLVGFIGFQQTVSHLLMSSHPRGLDSVASSGTENLSLENRFIVTFILVHRLDTTYICIFIFSRMKQAEKMYIYINLKMIVKVNFCTVHLSDQIFSVASLGVVF